MQPLCHPPGGFIVSVPSAGTPFGFYVPLDKSYRIAPPAGWIVIPSCEASVEFRSRISDQGHWPGMFIAKEAAEESQLEGAAKINALAAQDRKDFRFVLGEPLDLPFGRAYLVVYEHDFQNLRMRTAEAHFVQDGMRYWAPFNALAETFDRHFPAYLDCLKTFSHLGRNGSTCN